MSKLVFTPNGNLAWQLEFLKLYGSQPISYSTLQDGLNCYLKDGVGFASYGTHLGYNFVLGGPICSEKTRSAFLKEIIAHLKNPAFVQVDLATASILHREFNYKVTQLGVETFIPMQKYSLQNDPRKRNLRSFLRKGAHVAQVYELTQAQLESKFGVTAAHLDAISEAWMATKTAQTPLKFLVRNVVYADEPHVRKFYSIDKSNNLLGFVFLIRSLSITMS